MILAIETATNVCSVAFAAESGEIVEKRSESRGSHSEKLFLFIKELMEEHRFSVNELETVLVSEGPGSYTGLRIAASGVKGLLFGSGLKVLAVSTLASFAFSALNHDSSAKRIHAIIDARRKHVYHQLFKVAGGVINPQTEVKTARLDSFSERVTSGDYIIGTGIDRLDDAITTRAHTRGSEWITARSLIRLYGQDQASSFVKSVEPAVFDPKYYTSNQSS